MRSIKVLHLEPTDVCQLACPACARETDTTFNKRQQHHLTITQIQRHLTESQIKKLEKMYMCGVYGDPAAGKYTLDIYRWFRSLNSGIALGMNTNGALQTTFWWYELAKIMNNSHDYVIFSIDGLEDTNPTYRVNSNWNKLMANVESFISAGGRAHWDMLVYKHNQHQVDDCEKLAKDIGFKWFRAKVSRRELSSGLEHPINWSLPVKQKGAIRCLAKTEKSMYINALGKPSPCCWLGNNHDYVADVKEVEVTWKTPQPHPVCDLVCSTSKDKTVYLDQWQRETEFV